MFFPDTSIIGTYYVQLKNVHIHWTHKSGPKRGKEAYIPIPAKYAYAFGIMKGTNYSGYLSNSTTPFFLKAAGSQGKKDFAKQFQGAGNLQIIYDWYESCGAEEGDYVVVSVMQNNNLIIELIKQSQTDLIEQYGLRGENGRFAGKDAAVRPQIEAGFRLESLIIKNNRETVCEYHFMSESINEPGDIPFVTLFIGENGTGKSYALGVVAEILYAFQNNGITNPMPYEFYRLTYMLDGRHIEIAVVNDIVIAHCDDMLVDSKDTSILPQKVLAIAFMVNDRYPFKGAISKSQSIYEYLGMRMSSNATWINHLSSRASENIVELAAKGRLWALLNELSLYLKIDKRISISCELSDDTYSFSEIKQMSIEKLAGLLQQAAKKIELSRDYRSEQIRTLDTQAYHDLAGYLHRLIELDPFRAGEAEKVFGVVFDADTSQEELTHIQNDYVFLRYLKNLRFIKNVTLIIYKDGKPYSFDETSSGEKHILFTILNIANYIQNNSLILIDEPEISLHPNWQMMYIGFLKRVFKEYPSCHFVIASHSPYLVSDLSPNSSSLVVLRKLEDKRLSETISYSTYAWSTENILYNVFHVRTTRNMYFELDLRELISVIDNMDASKLEKAKALYNKVSSFVFDRKDPLNLILKEIEESIRNAESMYYS